MDLENHHDVFQAIADPTRRRILYMLSREEMTVTAIAKEFPISRPAISKHLGILKRTGLITERKTGREKRCQLNPEPLLVVQNWIQYYEPFWEKRLHQLGEHLRRKP